MRTTRLICTIGPASAHGVPGLVEAGTDIARVNFSHGTEDQRRAIVESVRHAARDAGRPVGVLADLCGPKLRLGELAGGLIELTEGSRFLLGYGQHRGDATQASANYPGLTHDLRPGDCLLLADGTVELNVVECGRELVTEVVRGGAIHSRAGLNVPCDRVSLPSVTAKDRVDLERALEMRADVVAQSFVRRRGDVRHLRELIGDRPVHVMAKVETRAAVEEADGILQEADAVMAARGDLAGELPFEEIPLVQKDLIRRAVAAGKPAIVATHMLRSMTASPRPTRAEASDVANAVLDGAEGILLSDETAIGRYPVEAARAAARIIEAAERGLPSGRADGGRRPRGGEAPAPPIPEPACLGAST